MMVRCAELDDEGRLGDQHAALAKAFCTSKARETAAWVVSYWAATALSPTIMWGASSPTPKLSIPTRARIRCKI